MGIISGYPVGAKIVNKFVEEGTCTKSEAERMLAFTNNSGPLFIIGTVGISLFGDTKIGIILFITHILACLTVGLIFGFVSKRFNNHSYNKIYTKTECSLQSDSKIRTNNCCSKKSNQLYMTRLDGEPSGLVF